MSGDNFSEEVPKVRPVLGDVTNLPVKRAFSSISDALGLKSRDGHAKKLIFEDGNSRLAKQVCLGVENLVKEKCKKPKIGVDNDSDENSTFPNEDKQSSNSSDTDTDVNNSQENNENKETPNLLEGRVNLLENVEEIGDASKDSCASTGSMSSKKDGEYDEVGLSSDVKQRNPEGLVCTSIDKDLGVGRLASSSQCGTVERSSSPKSQGGSRSFELGRCTGLKGDGCDDLVAGSDLLKACSCSFCLKAAYIWADLHYQDIKGRIAALKKSQKEASVLVNKYVREKQTDIRGQGNSGKSTQLESDLTVQWRSLFHHMEGIFVHESNQLQGGFAALKELRENCKTDLESINEMPSNKY